MKKIFVLTMFLAAVTSGCLLVQSFNPFYTADAVVAMPSEMKGKWYVVQQGERKVDKRDMVALIFKDGQMQARGEDVRWDFETHFFKAGDRLFMDFVLTGKPYTESHGDLLILTHGAFMVTVQPEEVRLHWLDIKWVESECKKRNIPFVVYEDEPNHPHNYAITAASKDLMELLTEVKTESGGFGDTWILKKNKRALSQ